MKPQNNFICFGLTALLFFLSLIGPAEAEITWESVPIRTQAQKLAGYAGGEGFQQVFSIAYAPSNPRIVYLSSDTSQVWKSTDEGETWIPKRSGFLANGARSLAVDPLNPDVVYAAGFFGQTYENARKYPYKLQGIYRTTDGGESWTLVKKADFYVQGSKGSLFAFDSTSSSGARLKTIYCATYDAGLLVSTDGGDTWRSLGLRVGSISDIEADPGAPGELFIAADNGLYKYRKAGTQKIGKGLPASPIAIAVSRAAPRTIFATAGDKGVFRSTDGGANFSQLRVLMPPLRANFRDIAVSAVNPLLVYLKADQSFLFREPFISRDGGNTWANPKSTDLGDLLADGKEGFWFSNPFAPHPQNAQAALMISNGRGRVLKTLDSGKNLAYSGNGYTGARLGDILFAPDGKMIFCVTDFGLLFTEDQGASFRELPLQRILKEKSSGSGDMQGKTILASLGNWDSKGLAISYDAGSTWKYFNELLDEYEFIAIHRQRNNVFFAGRYRSTNAGKSWSKLSVPVRAMHPANGDIVYSSSGRGREACTILKSEDQGLSWFSPYPPCPFKEEAIQRIVPAPNDQDRLFVATSWGIWVLEAGTWNLRDHRNGLEKDGFGLCFISSLAVDPNNPTVLYAGRRAPGFGHSNGVFRSLDGGLSWQNVSANMGAELTVWSIRINPADSMVYVGTSHGIYRSRGF